MGEDKGEKLKADAGFEGPFSANRRTTDVLFMLALIGVWVGMTAVGIDAGQRGSLKELLNGIDYDGRICGVSEGVGALEDLIYVNNLLNGVCIKNCPDETVLNGQTIADLAAISGPLGSQAYSVDADGYSFSGMAACIEYSGSYTLEDAFNAKLCAPAFETQEVINRCIFKDKDTNSAILASLEENDYVRDFLTSVVVTRDVIFGFGFVIAIVLSFLFLFLLEIPFIAFILVWVTVLLVLVLIIVMGVLMVRTGRDWKDDPTKSDYEWRGLVGLGYAFCALAALYVCMIIFLRKRINLAIGLVKIAARAVGSMRSIVLLPFVLVGGLALFVLPWVFYMLSLASLGDLKINQIEVPDPSDPLGDDTIIVNVRTYEYDDEAKRTGWFLLFALLWTSQFIVAVGYLTVAVAFSSYFFARDKSRIGFWTPFTSLAFVLRYHMGTAAFGSLIIAIIQQIRAVVGYIQKKAEEADNKIAKYLLCACQCCLWCLEKCMKFLNKNAYVQTAIFGSSFCKAAKDAFFLILRNILRVGAVTLVGSFVTFIGKVFVVSVATAGSFYIMDTQFEDKVNGLLLPTLFVFLLSYFTAELFMDIYTLAMLTMLQCFIADEEMGTGFADAEFKSFIDKNGKPEGEPGEFEVA